MKRRPLYFDGALLVVTIALLTLAGCAPFPHYEVVSPTVVGKVHRNGTAVDNAIVYIDHPLGQSCTVQGKLLTHTNAQGDFKFAAQKEFRLFVFMDPGVNWQVCIVDAERQYQGWYQNGIGGVPSEINLDCNLESLPADREIGYSLTVKGICKSDSEL